MIGFKYDEVLVIYGVFILFFSSKSCCISSQFGGTGDWKSYLKASTIKTQGKMFSNHAFN